MLLGDLGAEVIKVESPAGDDTRTWQPPVHDGVSTYYLGVNRNKRSVIFDLSKGEDCELAQELARRADVLVENFKPGNLEKFGLDYESVKATNPEIIYASISGFGSGAGAGIAGYDLMVQAISGLMSLTGDPDGDPYRAGVAVLDVFAGLHSAIGIVSALYARKSLGTGQRLEVNLLSSALSGMVNQTSSYVAGGVVPFRMGNAHPSLYPYEPMHAKDGDLVVAVGNDSQFRKFCEVLEMPEVAQDSRFSRNENRNANRIELRALISERIQHWRRADLFRALTAAGVPSGPINTLDEGVAFAEELGLSPVVTIADGAGEFNSIRNPIAFSATPPSYRLAPPTLGEQSQEIRTWLADKAPGG